MRNADSPHPSAPTESTSASEQDSPTGFVCTVKFEKHCHIISKWKKDRVKTLRGNMCGKGEYEGDNFGGRRQTMVGHD